LILTPERQSGQKSGIFKKNVNEMESTVLGRIKKSLTSVLENLEKEPIILVDADGGHWVNSFARQVITQRGIPMEDFIEWIKIGSSHLQNISHSDIQVHMMRLPQNEVIALLKPDGNKPDATKVALTGKQKDILHYVLKGFSNKEIANRMKISPGTVNSHLDTIYSKLGCSSRLEASLIALKKGLFISSPVNLSRDRVK
jgi:DNA-binding CsgD family transcriptional regulator